MGTYTPLETNENCIKKNHLLGYLQNNFCQLKNFNCRNNTCFFSVQFSRSVVFDSLRLYESQHARPPSPSPSPGVHEDSRPSSQWCHPDIPSLVIPFSSCPQSLLASESSPMSQLFAWGGQSTGVSALASFLPNKSQGWSPSEWTGWNIKNIFKLKKVGKTTRLNMT